MNDFELEVFLSTDGKHTVRMKAETEEGRDKGIPYAKVLYKKILEEFGTKQAQAVKEYKNGGSNIPNCGVHGTPMTQKTGQYGQFWSCGKKLDNGEWCKYRPPKK